MTLAPVGEAAEEGNILRSLEQRPTGFQCFSAMRGVVSILELLPALRIMNDAPLSLFCPCYSAVNTAHY